MHHVLEPGLTFLQQQNHIHIFLNSFHSRGDAAAVLSKGWNRARGCILTPPFKNEAWGELSPVSDTSIRNYSTEELNSILFFKKCQLLLIYTFFSDSYEQLSTASCQWFLWTEQKMRAIRNLYIKHTFEIKEKYLKLVKDSDAPVLQLSSAEEIRCRIFRLRFSAQV